MVRLFLSYPREGETGAEGAIPLRHRTA
jgi:hypothetical protein